MRLTVTKVVFESIFPTLEKWDNARLTVTKVVFEYQSGQNVTAKQEGLTVTKVVFESVGNILQDSYSKINSNKGCF